jgi:microsomal epoxide hydrolase
MALRYPKHTKAIHLNFIPSPPPYPWRNPVLFLQAVLGYIIPPFSASNRRKIATLQSYLGRENAYAKQQDTYPQTLGYALNDSPVGLLAWVYDKLHRWTDGYAWTDDEILSWVCIYAFSRAGPAASLRIYHESVVRPVSVGKDGQLSTWLSRDEVVSTRIANCVKIAVANFPGEIVQIPGTWLRAIGNIVRETEFEKGGHFAAWEMPQGLVQDLRAFMGRSGEAYAVVTNKDGF